MSNKEFNLSKGFVELGGRTDPKALRRIEEITTSVEGTGHTIGIVDDKLHQAGSWAGILFLFTVEGREVYWDSCFVIRSRYHPTRVVRPEGIRV